MRDCPNAEIRDLLPDLASDSLAGETRARVESHVAGCADCAAELALLRTVRRVGASAPAVDVARIVAALPAPGRAARTGWSKQWRIAAAIAVLAVGGLAVQLLRQGALVVEPSTPVVVQPSRASDSTALPSPIVVAANPMDSSPRTSAERSAGLSMTGGLGDLSSADLEALLADVERLDAMPNLEPEPTMAPLRSGAGT